MFPTPIAEFVNVNGQQSILDLASLPENCSWIDVPESHKLNGFVKFLTHKDYIHDHTPYSHIIGGFNKRMLAVNAPTRMMLIGQMDDNHKEIIDIVVPDNFTTADFNELYCIHTMDASGRWKTPLVLIVRFVYNECTIDYFLTGNASTKLNSIVTHGVYNDLAFCAIEKEAQVRLSLLT